MEDDKYKELYLKYKSKYIKLKYNMSGGGIFDFIRTAKKEDIDRINKKYFDIMMGKIKQEIFNLKYKIKSEYTNPKFKSDLENIKTKLGRNYNEIIDRIIQEKLSLILDKLLKNTSPINDIEFEILQIVAIILMHIDNFNNQLSDEYKKLTETIKTDTEFSDNLFKNHIYLTENENKMINLLNEYYKLNYNFSQIIPYSNRGQISMTNILTQLEGKKYTIKRVKQILKCYYDKKYEQLDTLIFIDECE